MTFRGVFIIGVLAALGVLQAESEFTLNIIHLNDTHSNLLPVSLPIYLESLDSTVRISAGGVARIASEVRRAKHEDENVLFLHAGDLVQGTLFYTVYGGRADAAVYNAMAPDVMALGNHEFDRGSEGLAFLLDEILFPVVCANIDVQADSLLRGRIAPHIVIDTGDERIGVIGLITGELNAVSSPSEQTIVLPLLETARGAVAELEEQGVNKIIILSHIGYAHDLQLAATVPGVDVIVGGHSHTLLGDFSHLGLSPEGEYPEVVAGPDGDPVLVVTAWRHGLVLGRLRVDFDSEGRVSEWLGSPVILAGFDTGPVPGVLNVNEDPLVADMVFSFAAALEDFQNEYVATAEEDLPNPRVPGGLRPEGSAIAPIVCDAMLWKANRLGIGADMALQNAGGVRIDVPEGEITIGTVYSLLPFGNTLVVLDATGAQIRAVIEESLSGIFDSGRSDGSFPYFAGLRYEAARNAPAGERVLTLEARTPDGYSPVSADAVYRIVTNTFVAGGGDGYGSLAGIPSTDTGFIDAEVLAEYLRMLGTVKPVEQRVFITGE